MNTDESNESRPRSLKRPLLYGLVGSVLLGAIAGIIIVLRDEWGWFEVRVILTTMTIAAASLCGLACDLSRTPRGSNFQPIASLILSGLGAGLILVGIWADLDSDGYWKTTATISIFAIATVHVSLLSMARLARRFAWVYFIAMQVIYGLAIIISALVITEPQQEEEWFRVIAVLSILSAAFTLLIPLLHRISKTDSESPEILTSLDERNLMEIDLELARLRQQIAALEQVRAEIAGSDNDSDQRIDD